MDNLYEVHDDFNELEFIVSSNSKEVFKEISEKIFGKNNLLLAIIETVTIGELSSIGTTEYLSYKPKNYIEDKIHKEYFEIINAIKGMDFGSPSQYYDWYRKKEEYYVIGMNNNELTDNLPTISSKTLEPTIQESANEYIYAKTITDDEIQSFFKTYIECLYTKEWFKELPHYFVIVKPISIFDKDVKLFIPVGNLYLIIGTKEKVEILKYKQYVNNLKTIWFNQNGYKILKEYSEKRVSDIYKPKRGVHVNLDKKIDEKIRSTRFSLNDYYYYTFDFKTHLELIGKHLISDTNHTIVKEIIYWCENKEKIKEKVNNFYSGRTDPNNILRAEMAKLEKHYIDKEEATSWFLKLLSKRRLALLLLLVCNFTEEETHEIVRFGERQDSKVESAGIYLRKNLLIYPKLDNKLFLADLETEFLQKVKTEIIKTKPNFKCLI